MKMRPPKEGMVRCECEHISHMFKKGDRGNHPHTPNGNPGHIYGVAYYPWFCQPTHTTGGTFNLCKWCREDCHAS